MTAAVLQRLTLMLDKTTGSESRVSGEMLVLALSFPASAALHI